MAIKQTAGREQLWTEKASADDARAKHEASMVFPIGKPNDDARRCSQYSCRSKGL